MLLTVCHRTSYRYKQAVTLLPHRLMLCPRGNYDLKLLTNDLKCSPAARFDWTQDVFGNLIATASFEASADRLTIESVITVEQCAEAWPIFPIALSAQSHPFGYSLDELRDLGALRADEPCSPALQTWLAPLVGEGSIDTLTLLQSINARINSDIAYRQRDEEGTQSADETIASASGSCRDLATLFIAAARQLGFGARAVSGYLYDPAADEPGGEDRQHGSTHAWAEVYLPGAGWIAFDPTNARMGSAYLVPVAVARGMGQIMPVTGGYLGAPDDFVEMDVDVRVSALKG